MRFLDEMYICIKDIIMKEILDQLLNEFEGLKSDAQQQIEKENKAAGTRARKSSLAIEKLMKEFRKASLDASKK